MEKVHIRLYGLIALLLITSYVFCGVLLVLLQDEYLWRNVITETARILIIAYLWGVIGGTSHCFLYFAQEANAHRERRPAPLPNLLEPPGYLIFLLFSGFAGSLLLALVHAGFIAAYNGTSMNEMSEFAVAVIAFVGGVAAEKVRLFCTKMSDELLRLKSGEVKKEGGTTPDPGKNE